MKIIVFLFVVILVLFIANYSNIKEGMETKSNCDAELQKTVYKNAGTVSNLEESVKNIMDKIDNILATNDKHGAQIGSINTELTKYEKMTEEADKIAKDNKRKILQAVEKSKEKSKKAQSKQQKLKPI